ncbi:methylaspartate mutase [Streptomyces somaliensis]|uniref:methylaspartate mutase n=1 Tax=Streptomyces somaliensis TaxID=78355 RepID=UPI0020CD3032|nr:methylaspartate mutase [Streptomyces somaliensis]MCP9945758.1 methylaspartate mutase [Streptomyces somaliensis]MCP9961065.1 methylaspartate mutase [Streptomyces somaliensis]MCP9973858.1 methylaspartate mutase [Streptomyces somaliensis]
MSAVVPLGSFASAVTAARRAGELVVQPRMGFADLPRMGDGLRAVKRARARTVGTLTIDSYTRVGDDDSARLALAEGADLNGYPIVAHGADTTRDLVAGLAGDGFAIQVRHGSANPLGIIRALLDAGLDATEGGPVSYCLPYSRTPLRDSVDAWARSCELLASRPGTHLESFGGCMLGQLCPPGLLVALSVLEGVFFRQHGLRSVSLSYAQQTHHDQDVEALLALRTLAGEHLAGLDWHVVLYTYMGVFPRTAGGALALLRDSARLAALTGTERMIVKTPAEAHRIPTIEDNVHALEEAALAAAAHRGAAAVAGEEYGVLAEARALVEAVLELHPDTGRALTEAFRRGVLDVPYCLHADNAQRSRSYIDARGSLQWHATGSMPIRPLPAPGRDRLGADDLLGMLSHTREAFDRAALAENGGRDGGAALPV